MSLRNHKWWDQTNGLLSVSINPQEGDADSGRYVMLNGSVGNFCLDYTEENFSHEVAIRRAWSSDTGYYVKVLPNSNVQVVNWWSKQPEPEIPGSKIIANPGKFYNAITKQTPPSTSGVIAFAKEVFIRLRNSIPIADNGQASLRTFMYLLAALKDSVEKPSEVNAQNWHLKEFDPKWIENHNWNYLYNSFKKGGAIAPMVDLVLRHASNRLFQEAHREATRKIFQTDLFGTTNRSYDSGISEGAFYTPTPLVRTIVQEALWSLNNVKSLAERPHIRILDPACGSAEFLREALRQLKINQYAGTVTITGWDISPIACEMSEFVLNYESISEWNNQVEIEITERDSLTHNWKAEQAYDLVLMNPPFRSYENLGDKKGIVSEQLNGLVKRQPDLSSVFWKKASEILAVNGAIGLVLPHSSLSAETYKTLREYIKEDLKIDFSLIGRLGSAGLFEKAMIIPSILVGVKSPSSKAHTSLWTDHNQHSVYTALRELRKYRNHDIPQPITNKEFSIYENELLTKRELNKNWAIYSFDTYQLQERLKNFTKVGQLFNITQGVIAGNNAAFILTKDEFFELPKKEQSFFRPCIMRESIKNGQLNDSAYLFFPYENKKISTEEELKNKLPQYYCTILLKHKSRLIARPKFEDKWWELNRPRSFHNRPKLVSSYFGRAGYFAYDVKGEYLVGQSFAWLPKHKELDSLEFHYAYLALLHSSVIDTLLEMVCNVLHGGYFDLSKHYIDNMPLPDLSKAEIPILNYLIKTGKLIQNGERINQVELNQVVANAYGLNIENFNLGM